MERKKLSAVIMASGHARRFGSNKLLAELEGCPLIAHLFRAIPKDLFSIISVVARDSGVLTLAEQEGLQPVHNPDESNDTAITIRLGLESLPPDTDACLFFVADQPWLTTESVRKMVSAFSEKSDCIYALSCKGQRGNPVLFPRIYFGELCSLNAHEQGKTVIARHVTQLCLIEAGCEYELYDVDYPSDLSPKHAIKCSRTD